MKRILFSVLFSLPAIINFAQNNAEAEKLVQEGVELHDKGEYDMAVKKYDAAIKLDKNYFEAYYEKSFSLYGARKLKECLEICKDAIKLFVGHPRLALVYIQYGNVLDDLGKTKQAMEIYDEGIRQYGDNYLLYFNKGLTLMKINQPEEALINFQQSLRLKPLHSSSNLYTGLLLQKENRIPALLSYLTFLAIEPQTKRSKEAYTRMNDILGANVKKEGNNTTIYLDPSVLNKKKDNKSENDFGTVEMTFSLMGALDNNKTIDSIARTPADKLSFKLQMLINTLSNSKKEAKGFYWEHYVPFFEAMKKDDQVTTLAHLAMIAANEEENNTWVKANESKIEEFYDWLKNYKWH